MFKLPFIIETARVEWGLVITDPTKSGTIPTSFPVESWNYLKRSFVVQPSGRVLAPLDVQSMLKTLNWWVPQPDLSLEDAMIERVDQVVQHLVSHTEDVWTELSTTIHQAMCKVFGPREYGGYFRTREQLLQARDKHYTEVRRPRSNFATARGQDPVVFARAFWQAGQSSI